MSNRYEQVSQGVGVVAFSVATVVANYLEDWVSGKSSWPYMSVMIAIITVVVLGQILSSLVTALIERWQWLRKLLFGEYYLGGTWVDLASKDDQVNVVGVTWFSIQDFQLQWDGENHNLDGKSVDGFCTHASIIKWPEVRFWFENDPTSEQPKNLEGICDLRFENGDDGRPLRYTGWARLLSEPGVAKVVGWKVTDKEQLKALHDPPSVIV